MDSGVSRSSCHPAHKRRSLCCCGLITMFLCLLIIGLWSFSSATFSSFSDLIPDVPNPLNVVFQNKCIEDLGCFYTGPPFFHPLNRPLSLTPTDQLKTKFILFTPSNPQTEEELNFTSRSIEYSSFDPKLPLKVLIHGYRSDLDVGDIRFELKDAFLNASDYNIIIVDWTEHNGPPYPQAVANARAVGAQLAKLLNLIMETTGFRAENIHIIGHSLGGQISGWAGERIKNLGRITGLDPAGPYFQDGENEVRLDATDAMFVDIIHTDGGENVVDGLGIGDPVGHMDFYPNGGRRQPGCFYTSESRNLVGTVVNSTKSKKARMDCYRMYWWYGDKWLKILFREGKERNGIWMDQIAGIAISVTSREEPRTFFSRQGATTKWLSNGCDHGRASNYFLESIDNSRCRFLATWCNSYNDFEKGDCLPQNSTMSEMGLHAKRIPGVPIKSKFFLRTNDKSPFCIENSVYLKNDNDTIYK